jgi:hypothetical protein
MTWPACCSLVVALGLSACASTSGSKGVTDAATTPLSDLNLVKAEIPPVLAEALKAPYRPPAAPGCEAIAAEVSQLEVVLGADLDVPPSPHRPSLIERGSSAAGEAAVGALRGAAEGVIPFRGWVRRLSGAERYSREVAAAIAAGAVRRSYLKGVGQARGCAAPAAPAAPAAAASAA